MELELQKRFLDEQQKLLDATLEVETSKSRVSQHDSFKRVEEWVRCNEEQEEGAVGGKKLPAVSQIHPLQPVPKNFVDATHILKRQRQQKQKLAEKLLMELQNQLEEGKKQFAVVSCSCTSSK